MDDCCLDRDSRFDRLPRKIAATQAWSRNPPDSISGTVVPRSTLSGKQSLEIRHVHHSSHRSCSAADRRRSNLASQSKLGLRSFRPAGPGARGGPGDGAREPDAHLTVEPSDEVDMPRPADIPEPTKPALPDPDPDDLPIKDPPAPGTIGPDVPIKDPPRLPEPPS